VDIERVYTHQFVGDEIFQAIDRFCSFFRENEDAFRLYEIAKNESVPFEECFLCIVRAIESLAAASNEESQPVPRELGEIGRIVSRYGSEDAQKFFNTRIGAIRFGRRSLSQIVDSFFDPLRSFNVFSTIWGRDVARLRGKLTHRAGREEASFYQSLFYARECCLLAFEAFVLCSVGIKHENVVKALGASEKYRQLLRQDFGSVPAGGTSDSSEVG
jgi:hypothetical protein